MKNEIVLMNIEAKYKAKWIRFCKGQIIAINENEQSILFKFMSNLYQYCIDLYENDAYKKFYEFLLNKSNFTITLNTFLVETFQKLTEKPKLSCSGCKKVFRKFRELQRKIFLEKLEKYLVNTKKEIESKKHENVSKENDKQYAINENKLKIENDKQYAINENKLKIEIEKTRRPLLTEIEQLKNRIQMLENTIKDKETIIALMKK